MSHERHFTTLERFVIEVYQRRKQCPLELDSLLDAWHEDLQLRPFVAEGEKRAEE